MTGIPDELVERAARAIPRGLPGGNIHVWLESHVIPLILEAIGLPALLERVEAAEGEVARVVANIERLIRDNVDDWGDLLGVSASEIRGLMTTHDQDPADFGGVTMPDRGEVQRRCDEMWEAFGCARNPDSFKASVRESLWERMRKWAAERDALAAKVADVEAVAASAIQMQERSLARMHGGEHFPAMVGAQAILDIFHDAARAATEKP